MKQPEKNLQNMESNKNDDLALGGGLLKRTIPLTDEERQQYVDFFAGKGIYITSEQVQLVDGVVNIQMEGSHG